MFGLFGLSKELKEIADGIIGPKMHEQIHGALLDNEPIASQRLTSCFVISYFIGFTITTYQNCGFNGQESLNKAAKHILDGVIPKRLDQLFDLHTAKAKLAVDLERRGGEAAEFMDEWRLGAKVGRFDADNDLAFGLSRFLVGDDLGEFLDSQPAEREAAEQPLEESPQNRRVQKRSHQEVMEILAPMVRRQIEEAFQENERMASMMVDQGFVYGYIDRFISKSFLVFQISEVVEGLSAFDFDTVSKFCDLVEFEGLKSTLSRLHQLLCVDVLNDEYGEKLGESWSYGVGVGLEDSLRLFADNQQPNSLKRFLLGEALGADADRLTADQQQGEYDSLLKKAQENAKSDW